MGSRCIYINYLKIIRYIEMYSFFVGGLILNNIIGLRKTAQIIAF